MADVAATLQELQTKLGTDQEAAVLITALTSAWAETSARLKHAEGRLNVVGGIATRGLTELITSLSNVQQQMQTTDAELASLHQQIATKLDLARQLSAKADTAMQDVLKSYSDFNGSVVQLKTSVAGLATAALTSISPGLGPLVAAPLKKVLGLPA